MNKQGKDALEGVRVIPAREKLIRSGFERRALLVGRQLGELDQAIVKFKKRGLAFADRPPRVKHGEPTAAGRFKKRCGAHMSVAHALEEFLLGSPVTPQ